MSVVDRKLCAGCGEPNLGSDLRCWACGGTQFAPLSARLAGERTVHLTHPLEVTQEWERERPRWMPLVYLGTAAAFALFMWIVGFWIGRSSGEPPAVAQAPTLQAPIILPTPPTGLRTTASPPGYSGLSTAPQPVDPDPLVQVRPAAPVAAPTTPKMSPASPPTTVVYNSPGRTAVSQPARVTTIYTYTREPAPLPVATPKIPPATGKTSVVSLRNDTAGSIEVTFDGPTSQTATVSAGSTLPMVIPPGSYQMRVSGSHAAPGRSAAVLGAGKSYSLVVDGRKEEGANRLVIEEPALGGG